MRYNDYYKVLGVDQGASQPELQKAYRSLARKYHPDVNQDSGAESRFKDIGEAYEVLGDPEKRKKYDQYGSAWNRVKETGSAPAGWDGVRFDFGGPTSRFDLGQDGFSSFFEMLFGDQAAARGPRPGGPNRWRTQAGRRPSAGQDRESRLEVSLEELAQGGKRKVELVDQLTGQRRSLVVTLPKGILPGKKIRLRGQGDPGADGSTGDLYLTMQLRPHPTFRLEDRDLHTELPLSPWEAALGAEISVPTLEGSVNIRLPAGSSTGRKIRLRGRGLPGTRGSKGSAGSRGSSGADGDLYLHLEITIPEKLSEPEKEAFEALQKASTFDPRPIAPHSVDPRSVNPPSVDPHPGASQPADSKEDR